MMKAKHTKEELLEKLTEELEDELEGIKEYDEIYESFKAHGMHDEARMIERIAEDEYTHACAIWEMMKEHGVDISDHEKIQSDWDCVKRIFNI